MDYAEELKRIDEKYYGIIVEKYGKYIKDLDKKDRLYLKTKVFSDKKWNSRFPKQKNARGLCVSRNGKIYIKETGFCEQVVIHEYIHRLSRNFQYKGKLRFGWAIGIMHMDKQYLYNGVNEVLTEWIAYSITGILEENIYCVGFKAIKGWQNKPEYFEQIIQAYFSNDVNEFINALSIFHNASTGEVINSINYVIDDELQKIPPQNI